MLYFIFKDLSFYRTNIDNTTLCNCRSLYPVKKFVIIIIIIITIIIILSFIVVAVLNFDFKFCGRRKPLAPSVVTALNLTTKKIGLKAVA